MTEERKRLLISLLHERATTPQQRAQKDAAEQCGNVIELDDERRANSLRAYLRSHGVEANGTGKQIEVIGDPIQADILWSRFDREEVGVVETVEVERHACGCEFLTTLIPERIAKRLPLPKCSEWWELDRQFVARKITGSQFSRLSAQHAKKTRSELVQVEVAL